VRGQARLLPTLGDDDDSTPSESTPTGSESDPRDYDADYYARMVRETFAARMVRALTPGDFAAVFADPGQPSLFAPSLTQIRPILTPMSQPDVSSRAGEQP
jgi:hypothetical protein